MTKVCAEWGNHLVAASIVLEDGSCVCAVVPSRAEVVHTRDLIAGVVSPGSSPKYILSYDIGQDSAAVIL